MEGEYNAEVVMSPMGKKDRSLDQAWGLGRAHVLKPQYLGQDRFDQPVFSLENDFALRWFADSIQT